MSHYLGLITLTSLRDYILDNNISEDKKISLNTIDFDNIILEYREHYHESISFPFFIVGVSIEEDSSNLVSLGRLEISERDYREDDDSDENVVFYDPIYRCGWCGNVVDLDGRELATEDRTYFIGIIEKYSHKIIQKDTDGYCCRNKWDRPIN